MKTKVFNLGRICRFRLYTVFDMSDKTWLVGIFLYGPGGPIDEEPWVGFGVSLVYAVFGIELLPRK